MWGSREQKAIADCTGCRQGYDELGFIVFKCRFCQTELGASPRKEDVGTARGVWIESVCGRVGIEERRGEGGREEGSKRWECWCICL